MDIHTFSDRIAATSAGGRQGKRSWTACTLLAVAASFPQYATGQDVVDAPAVVLIEPSIVEPSIAEPGLGDAVLGDSALGDAGVDKASPSERRAQLRRVLTKGDIGLGEVADGGHPRRRLSPEERIELHRHLRDAVRSAYGERNRPRPD